MAYAALSSLMHTLEQLLQRNQRLVCSSCIQPHVESAHQSLCDLQVFLEDTTKEITDTEILKVLEKRIRYVIYKAEDRVDSSLRSIIILADCGEKRERACRSFYEELLKVEKEVNFLKKEVMLIKFKNHGSDSTEFYRTSTSSRKYATEKNTIVGMKDDFNFIIRRLTAQTDELTIIPIVGMGGIDFPPHKMSFLSSDESWNLFIERVFRKDPCPPQLEQIGKHIIQQCQGLPLSIIVIAGLLVNVEPTNYNWKKVKENLNRFFGTVSEQCQAILSLSYNYLPQHLKACFLYIGGFPEDMEISVSKLTRLWIAELFVNARSNKSLEVVAEEYLQELIDRSLILAGTRRANGRMKTCKIHDLLRQLCIREAQIENVGHVMDDNINDPSGVINNQRRVMLPLYIPEHWSGLITSTMIGSLVCTRLYYEPLRQHACSSVSHFKLLKVLDVSSCYCDCSCVLPHLVLLRHVSARIGEAPSLAKLWNLQTIILDTYRRTYLHLPPDMWTMAKIRHLDIGLSIHMSNPLEAESREQQFLFLNNLKTLALPSSPFVAEILRRTPNINVLKIKEVYSNHWSAFLDGLFFLKELEKLHIWGAVSRDTIILSRDIFLPNLKKLTLYETFLPWEDMAVLANLTNLELLKAKGAFWGTDWTLNEGVVFQKLKYLQIQRGNLERWKATSDNFPVLEQLVLIGLRFLKEIPQSIGEIMTLKLIRVEYCSSAVITSAKKIQQEQESWGNYGLQVQTI